MIKRIPYPVPQKRQKPRSGIERAPKRIWLRHRRFVKSHCCCVPGCPALLVDPAHLRSVVNDGTGLTPFDWFLVPLCRHHHQEQEPLGPDAFGDRHGIDLLAIAAELARKSPDTNMRLAYLEWQADQEQERHAPPKPSGSALVGPDRSATANRSGPPLLQLIPLRGTVR